MAYKGTNIYKYRRVYARILLLTIIVVGYIFLVVVYTAGVIIIGVIIV